MKRTKRQLYELRESSYVGPVCPEKRCENCRHGWFENHCNQCHAVQLRGMPYIKTVHRLGCCELWMPEELR
jgi:hypothetical protein